VLFFVIIGMIAKLVHPGKENMGFIIYNDHPARYRCLIPGWEDRAADGPVQDWRTGRLNRFRHCPDRPLGGFRQDQG